MQNKTRQNLKHFTPDTPEDPSLSAAAWQPGSYAELASHKQGTCACGGWAGGWLLGRR